MSLMLITSHYAPLSLLKPPVVYLILTVSLHLFSIQYFVLSFCWDLNKYYWTAILFVLQRLFTLLLIINKSDELGSIDNVCVLQRSININGWLSQFSAEIIALFLH